jgi:conjugal transfer mating pair stabilization protein TraN
MDAAGYYLRAHDDDRRQRIGLYLSCRVHASGSICSQTSTAAASPVYACPGGWSLSGTMCVRGTTYTATANYSCPNGFTLSGSTCSRTLSQAATASYSCPGGYSLNGTTCSQTSTTGATQVDQCIDSIFYKAGSNNLEANYCGRVESNFPGNNCPQPTWNGMKFHDKRKLPNSGIIKNCLYIPIKANTCPNGYTLNGATCSIVYTQNATASYSCPNGGSLSGTTCTTTNTTNAAVSYTCPANHALNGTTCTSTQSQPASVSYSCLAGYALSGTTCTASESQQASVNYSCPSGGSLSGTTCSTVETASATPTYECPTGYTLDGSLCRVSAAATPSSWSCPAGWTLSGSTCSQVLQQPATPIQICPNGGDLIDGACVTVGQKTECTDLEANPQCKWLRDTCLDETQSGPCKVTERTYSCPVPGEQGRPTGNMSVRAISTAPAGPASRSSGSRRTSSRTRSSPWARSTRPTRSSIPTSSRCSRARARPATSRCSVSSTAARARFPASSPGRGGHGLYGARLGWRDRDRQRSDAVPDDVPVRQQREAARRQGSPRPVPLRRQLCSSSFLGVCTTKRKTYCCFESKLTRIIQEQGRPQIDKPWGPPKTEQCVGLTLDEFSRLDFSKMDFSEIYSEFLESAKLPDQAQMASDIQAKIKAYYQQNATSGSATNGNGGN